MIPFLCADRPISLSIIKGITLPTGSLIGIMGQANTTARFQQSFSSYPYDVRVVHANGQPATHLIAGRTVKMVDSGIFNKWGCKTSYAELFRTYRRMRADYGVIIDVFKDADGTVASAKKAIAEYRLKRRTFELVGVAQGDRLDEYIRCYERLIRLGYNHIAIGGLLRRRKNTVRYCNVRCEALLDSVLRRIRAEFDPKWLFVLGAFHPKRLDLFREHGVWGSDYKGWIFNYKKKDEVLSLIRADRLDSAYRVADKRLTVRAVSQMSEQQLRFHLTRKFVEKSILKGLLTTDER